LTGLATITAGLLFVKPGLLSLFIIFLGISGVNVAFIARYRIFKAVQTYDSINYDKQVATWNKPWQDRNFPGLQRFPIAPTSISWEHSLESVKLELNYAIQFARYVIYRIQLPFKIREPDTRDLLVYILNCTILTLLKIEDTGAIMKVTLDIPDLHSPFYDDGKKVDLYVEFHLDKQDTDIERGKLIHFLFDGHRINAHSEQLIILSTVTANYIHPLLHSFFGNLYQDYEKL